jgi:hypothetical protein
MCIGISAIALQRGDRRLLYKSGVNGHGQIREVFGIGDYRCDEQVNLEAHPGPCLTEIDGWTIHVDHEGDPPQWYQEERIEIESAFRDFYEAEIREMRETGVYDGDLNLRGTPITSLGVLRECGDLELRGTPITSLGELRKCGRLNLFGTPITSLGGLRECGDLWLTCTPITSLGGMQKCGNLRLFGTKISIPQNLKHGEIYL